MKTTKRSWFIHLLGLLALVLTSGVMLVGCDLPTIMLVGGVVVGGIIGGVAGNVIVGIIIGGIIGLVILRIISGGTSSSSSGGSSMSAYRESRKNDPHTCGNCTKYSSGKGECRLNGASKSAGDSCSDWC